MINAAADLRAACEGGHGVAPLRPNGDAHPSTVPAQPEAPAAADARPVDDAAVTHAAQPHADASTPDAAVAAVLGDEGGYRLVAADLRDIPGLDAAVAAAGFDPRLPTLFLSECCLVYMEPEVRGGARR